MATSTYTPLATVTLTGSDSEIVFGSIPGSYRDIIVVVKTTSATDSNIRLRFNADSGSNYTYVGAGGNGSSTSSVSGTRANILTAFSGYTNHFITAQIMDYSATDKHKTVLVRGESAGEWASMVANRWASTSAITSITILSDEAAWATGSTFSLWGIAA